MEKKNCILHKRSLINYDQVTRLKNQRGKKEQWKRLLSFWVNNKTKMCTRIRLSVWCYLKESTCHDYQHVCRTDQRPCATKLIDKRYGCSMSGSNYEKMICEFIFLLRRRCRRSSRCCCRSGNPQYMNVEKKLLLANKHIFKTVKRETKSVQELCWLLIHPTAVT